MTVYAAELLGLDGDRAAFRVRVSTGTYIRALARDLGERLGVGAHLDELRREAVGGLRVEDAVPLADVGPGTPLVPLTRVLEHLPAVALDEVQRADVRHGRRLSSRGTPQAMVTNTIARRPACSECSWSMRRRSCNS